MYSRISSLIWFQMSVDQKGNMNETGRWRGVWLDVERGRHWGAGGFQLDPLSPLCIQLLFPAVGPVGKSSPRSTTRLSGNSFHRLSVSLWLSHWSSRMCLWKLQLCASGGLVRNSTLIDPFTLQMKKLDFEKGKCLVQVHPGRNSCNLLVPLKLLL